MQLNIFYNMKLHVFKSSGESTYNSDSENFYHPKFDWYTEMSSLADINPKSYHLIAFELVNPLLYIYFHFFERSEAYVGLCFATSLIERLRNESEDKTKTQMTQSFDQYSENETKIWLQNILNQFNRVSSSCLRSDFVIFLICVGRRRNFCFYLKSSKQITMSHPDVYCGC